LFSLTTKGEDRINRTWEIIMQIEENWEKEIGKEDMKELS